MKFKPTYLRNNRIRIAANIADRNEYKAEILHNGSVIGVPLYQTPFNNVCEFRLEAIIRSQQFHNALPDADNISIVTITDYLKRFSLRFQRADGSGSATTISEINVQSGGVPDYVFNAGGNPVSAVNPFAHRCTFQPQLKRISLAQPEFIFFFNNPDPAVTVVNVNAIIRFEDGTQLVQSLQSKPIAAYQLTVINVSPWVLEEYLLGRPIAGYDIQIADQLGSKIFEDHIYEIDTRYHQHETFLVYQNSFGCWDVLRCFGDAAESEAVTRSIAENETERSVFHTEGRRTLTLNTGHQEQGMKEALPEILFSKQIYRFDGLQSQRLNLLTDSLEAYNTNADDGVSLEFEYITEDLAYAP
jgi:hypothetical protein